MTKTLFPELLFWNQNAKSLEFINEEDFHKQELLEKTDIASHPFAFNLSTCDRSEILRRQEIVKLLYQNENLRSYILSHTGFRIPVDGQQFMNYFNPQKEHNPFWEAMMKLDTLLDKARKKEKPSGEIVIFHEFLKKTMKEMEEKEKIFSTKVCAELDKVSAMQGKVTLVTAEQSSRYMENFRLDKAEGYGYQKYSFYASGFGPITKPKKLKWWLLIVLAVAFLPLGILGTLFIWSYNIWQKSVHFSPLVIKKVPAVIIDSIIKLFESQIANNTVKQPTKVSVGDRLRITLYFAYDSEKGLKTQVVNIETIGHVDLQVTNPFNKFANDKSGGPIDDSFYGYSAFTVRKINRLNKKLMESLAQVVRSAKYTRDITAYFEEMMPSMFNEKLSLPSQNVDRSLKYSSIEGIFESPEFKPMFEHLNEYRSYIESVFMQLGDIARLVNRFEQAAKRLQVPVTFPEILSSKEHLVTFKELIPIHLIGREDRTVNRKYILSDLVPIHSLAPLNGKMLALTGQNAGGKTVTEETLIGAIYLAQAGLPIFGTGMKLNPKNTLALVFIERGNGSTAELLLGKIKNVLTAVKQAKENGIVVIMDELGTGTQEVAGAELGRKVLEVLYSKKCSVIFSSQITSLVEYAEETYGALPFKFNLNHQIESGIGKGEINLLVKKLNMEELLEV